MRRILTVLCALLGVFASTRATAQEIQLIRDWIFNGAPNN